MNYHLNQDGSSAGIFPLDELQRRRAGGELTGTELVWCSGMPNWLPLDVVLAQKHLEANPSRRGPSPGVIWAIGLGIALFVAVTVTVALAVYKFTKNPAATAAISQVAALAHGTAGPNAPIAEATQPVHWKTNSITEAQAQKQKLDFRLRQWVDNYQRYGKHDVPCDADAALFIKAWITRAYGGDPATNLLSDSVMGDKLAGEPGCTDPLVLAVSGETCVELHVLVQRLERAVTGFRNSPYPAYPKFNTSVVLARYLSEDQSRVSDLDASSVRYFKELLKDGSIQPSDQPELAEILVNGWAAQFFKRNRDDMCHAADSAGSQFKWLALTLNGEREIVEAWNSRGNDYANNVSEKGWQGFNEHLAKAHQFLEPAWQLHPEYVLAADRMITVSLGESSVEQMRVWFDRCVDAQFDYARAWSDFRWGLRPRWFGNPASVLAFGVESLNTKRFDTDVPRKFYDAVMDVQDDEELPFGRYSFDRPDIWPHLQQMYEGYISEPKAIQDRDGWRSAYAVVAYLAGKYDIARAQLAALDCESCVSNKLLGWNRELSLLPLEVAARTGSAGRQISAAERDYSNPILNESALAKYTDLISGSASNKLDDQTLQFVLARVAQLKTEMQFKTGQWVDFLPRLEQDPAWVFSRDEEHHLVDGALEVKSGAQGHFAYNRARVGGSFEVKGEFEVVSTTTGAFQGGLVFGLPDVNSWNWYAFRIVRNLMDPDYASFAIGWGKNHRIHQPIKLNDQTNSFVFRFEHNRVTASVNGQEVIHEAKTPGTVRVSPADFQLGVGAFNDLDETVIRYHNVQIRKL